MCETTIEIALWREREYGYAPRRGGRVVEGARLESVYTVKRIEGSNPSLSATFCIQCSSC